MFLFAGLSAAEHLNVQNAGMTDRG